MADQAQQGREAGWRGLLFEQTRTWSATEGKGNLAEPLELPVCPSSIGRCQRRKPFRKGLVNTRCGKAEKPAHLDPQHHGTSLSGQIHQRSHVATMHTCGQGRARRTRCARLRRRQHENEAILVYQNLFQMHVGRKKQELSGKSGKHAIRFQWRITWRIQFVFLYDTTSRPFTESATEPKNAKWLAISINTFLESGALLHFP